MSTLFISYSTKDRLIANTVYTQLIKLGYQPPFRDDHPSSGIPVGSEWEQELYRKLRLCKALVVLVSPRWLESNWCFAELAYARALGKALFPILINDDIAMPAALVRYQGVRLNDTKVWDRLARGLSEAGLSPENDFPWPVTEHESCPYPGLAAFEAYHAGVYFGRDQEVQELRELLEQMVSTSAHRLLYLVGASGSGKSSLVKAGLLPRLECARSEGWLVLPVFRWNEARGRGRDWAEQLAVDLRSAWPEGATALGRQQLSERYRLPSNAETGAVEMAAQRFIDDVKTLIDECGVTDLTPLWVLDQFEEILVSRDDPDSVLFLRFIGCIAASPRSPLRLIATLRTDFLAEVQSRPELASWKEYTNLYSLSLMSTERFYDVVRGPADRMDVHFENDALVDRVVNDTGTSDALPLLAFALRELYHQLGESRTITNALYDDRLGGLEGCLSKVANELLAEEDDINRYLYLVFSTHLVRINEQDQFVRRSVGWQSLPEEAKPLLKRFVDRRLIISRPRDEADPTSEEVIEVVHEALFRRWHTLARWLDQRRDLLRWRKNVEDDRQQSIGSGRVWTGLTPAQYEIARVWPQTRTEELSEVELGWVQSAANRRLLIRATIIAIITLITALASYSWYQTKVAVDARSLAQERLLAAETEKRNTVVELVRGDSQRAIDLLDKGGRVKAIDILLAAGSRIAKHRIEEAELPEFREAAVRTLLHLPEIRVSEKIGFEVSVLPSLRRLIGSKDWKNGRLMVFDFEGDRVGDMHHPDVQLDAVTADLREEVLYSLSTQNGLMRRWRASDLELLSEHHIALPAGLSGLEYEPQLNAVVFITPEALFTFNLESNSLVPLDETWRALLVPKKYQERRKELYELAKSSDSGRDITNRTWRTLGPRRLVGYNLRSPVAVTGMDDGLVRVWDITNLKMLRAVPFPDRVYNLLLSPQGDLAAAVGEKGYFELLNLHHGHAVARYPDLVSAPSAVENFDFDGNYLQLHVGDGVRLIKIMPHLTPSVSMHEDVHSARLDGETILMINGAGEETQTLAVYNPQLRRVVASFKLGDEFREMVVPLRYFEDSRTVLVWTQWAVYEARLPSTNTPYTTKLQLVAKTEPGALGLTQSFPPITPAPDALFFRADDRWRLLERKVRDSRSLWREILRPSTAQLPKEVRDIRPYQTATGRRWLVVTESTVFDLGTGAAPRRYHFGSDGYIELRGQSDDQVYVQWFPEGDEPPTLNVLDLKTGKRKQLHTGVWLNWESSQDYRVFLEAGAKLAVTRISDGENVSSVDLSELGSLWASLPGRTSWGQLGEDSLSGFEGIYSGVRNDYAQSLKVKVSEAGDVIIGLSGTHVFIWSLTTGTLIQQREAFPTQRRGGLLYRGLVDPAGRFFITLEGSLNRVVFRSTGTGQPLYEIPLRAGARYGFGDGGGGFYLVEGYSPQHRLLHIGTEVTDILRLDFAGLVSGLAAAVEP